MSLTKILSEKDTDAEDQLVRVAEIVAKARDNYGNAEEEIEAPMVDTVHGRMSFVHLEAESQVAKLRDRVGTIKATAVEFIEQTPGANLTKKIEELLALDAYFANVGSGTKFEYL